MKRFSKYQFLNLAAAVLILAVVWKSFVQVGDFERTFIKPVLEQVSFSTPVHPSQEGDIRLLKTTLKNLAQKTERRRIVFSTPAFSEFSGIQTYPLHSGKISISRVVQFKNKTLDRVIFYRKIII